MIRNLKVLGLAVVSALALTAVVASPASAEFHGEEAHLLITGSQEGTGHTFVTNPGTVHCKKATFSGTTNSSTVAEVTAEAAYSECKLTSVFGEITVTVTMNGCDYDFHTNGHATLTCPEGKTVVVSGPGCTLTIGAPKAGQTLTNNTFTNIGSGTTRELIVHTAVEGIEYSHSGFLCGTGTNLKNGKYNGTTRITATNTAGVHRGIWTSHPQ